VDSLLLNAIDTLHRYIKTVLITLQLCQLHSLDNNQLISILKDNLGVQCTIFVKEYTYKCNCYSSIVAEQLANTLMRYTLDVVFGRLVGYIPGSRVRNRGRQGL